MSLTPSSQTRFTAKHLSHIEVVAGWCTATFAPLAVVHALVSAIQGGIACTCPLPL